ncbi:thioredoxin reductase [Desulfotomaculum nigrificans CO-1-SRB]|uniref:Thioredoxin reductase n=1 Tax=Desulfotomaculum nigrificans (strain DSM 14880 / VKM B-2319 / CO-1-SRB) TaxID=868595 RepID=F6B4S7_DESCC|nr:thioredoxin-disulfide reductase [Desulfotomaculum nigrificans]AEF94189.1 thioredoxin reductase [Desulfotomaculum nigrificans CO-1-SRB]
MQEKDLVIIGGGPAGYTAGLYAARADINSILIERGMPGGQAAATEWIENYPGFPGGIGGIDLAMKFDEQARSFGLEILNADVEKLERHDEEFIVYAGGESFKTKAVILASGAKPQYLGVEGESKFHGRGVSYCATCDGAFFRDKTVAVVGGGDAAVEEALFLTKFAGKVYIIHRRGELRATKLIQKRAMANEKIEFLWHSVVDRIVGENKVEAVKIKNVQTGELTEVPVDGVFVYVGTRANSDLVKNLVEMDERGYIITDEKMATNIPGLFAIGDVRQKPLRQVVTAVADGAIAAMQVEKYLADLEK